MDLATCSSEISPITTRDRDGGSIIRSAPSWLGTVIDSASESGEINNLEAKLLMILSGEPISLFVAGVNPAPLSRGE